MRFEELLSYSKLSQICPVPSVTFYRDNVNPLYVYIVWDLDA